MNQPCKDHSRASPEGRALGEKLVRITEPWVKHLAAEGEADERCKTCAFRAGTVPNGCIQTQMDAFKALVEKVPFGCHQRSGICHGWYAASVGIRQNEKVKGPMAMNKVPWEFSPADDKQGGAACS